MPPAPSTILNAANQPRFALTNAVRLPSAAAAMSFPTEMDDAVPIIGRRLQQNSDHPGEIDAGHDVVGIVGGKLLQGG